MDSKYGFRGQRAEPEETKDRTGVGAGHGMDSAVPKLISLAILFDHLISYGFVNDQAKLARRGHVTRVRLIQIMNLLNLAADMLEELLFLPPVDQGKDAVTERDFQAIVAEVDRGRRRLL